MRRFVHLGDRLLAIGRVRAGVVSAAQAARALGVSVDDIHQWEMNHGADRTVSLREFRTRDGAGELGRLRMRARRLADLVVRCERALRELNHELLRTVDGVAPAARKARRSSKEIA